MKTLTIVIFLTILVALHNLCLGQAVLEFHEDFSGDGDLQVDSNYYGVKSGVLTTDSKSIYYGQILTPSEIFAGLKSEGLSNYYASTQAHSLRIRDSQDLNATAKVLSGADEFGNATRSTFFAAQGEGSVRERVLSQGKFGRPVDLSSLYHTEGRFKINSTTSERVL